MSKINATPDRPLVACRFWCYGEYAPDVAWTELPKQGIHHFEMDCPEPADIPDLKKKLADHGLAASSIQCKCDVKSEDVVEAMKPQLDVCVEMDAIFCYTSVNGGDTPRDLVWQRLRAIGDEAAQRDLFVSMETHPDLVHNGDEALKSMHAIDHPNVRVNFDTANVLYYNENTDTITELEKIADHVGSMHLKESTGGYRVIDFPALGKGIVDYARVFQVMSARGFAGPYTMELEGPEKRSREDQIAHVATSAAHLRAIGMLKE